MQHLQEKWLKYLNIYYLLASLAIIGGYIYLALEQQKVIIDASPALGINTISAGLAIICILFIIGFSKLIRRFSIWLSYVIPFALFSIVLSTCIDIATNPIAAWIYLVNLILISIAAVAYGYIVALAVISIVMLFYAMTLSSTIPPTFLGTAWDGVVVIIRIFLPSVAMILLRNKYVFDNPRSKETYVERFFVDNEVVKLLTDSISDGVIITDKNGIIRSINQSAGKLLKQDIKDLVDLDFRSILRFKSSQHTDISEDENPIVLALSSKQTNNTVYILELKNKQEIFTDIVASAIKNTETGEIYGCVVIMRDVSKKKQEEEARSEFISTASHEMRTPVAAIEGYLALALNENVAKIDDKARSFLQKAHLSTEHLGRLFQDLLVSAKAEDGRLVSHPTVMEMGNFLEQLADDLKLITSKKGLGLEYVTGTGENLASGDKNHTIRPLYYVFADPDRLREIITNLFDNAVKYTASGKVTIGLTGNKDVVQFFVRDTGTGIPAEDIPHLFQKFYRVDNRATRTTGGTGLGLFISRKILELYNGRIWVESEVNKGSTFYVNLPRIDSTKASQIANQPPTETSISIKPTSSK